MSKLLDLLKKGEITLEEITAVPDLIERAKFVQQALEACKKTLLFPMGSITIPCYNYTDSAGEYEAWGEISHNGVLTMWSNWGGNHQIGQVNLNQPYDILKSLDDKEFGHDLKRFLDEQIKKAENI